MAPLRVPKTFLAYRPPKTPSLINIQVSVPHPNPKPRKVFEEAGRFEGVGLGLGFRA